MTDLVLAFDNLTLWETVIVVWIADITLQIGHAFARWLLDSTVGQWLDEQGNRLADAVARRMGRARR